jgi:hypothetical protein
MFKARLADLLSNPDNGSIKEIEEMSKIELSSPANFCVAGHRDAWKGLNVLREQPKPILLWLLKHIW